jgi:hypothetical protein
MAASRGIITSTTQTISTWRIALRERTRIAPELIGIGLLALVYVAAATLPSFHYDLLVNYIGVPKDYLIQGHLGGLDHNVHSAFSMPFHAFIAFALALGEPLTRSPFLFGWAPVWGAMHLVVTVLIGDVIRRIAIAVTADSSQATMATAAGLILWLAMPQTLLLASLENAEFLTTYLGLLIVLVALTGTRRDDILVIGLLSGLLIAAKPQLVFFAAVALVVAPRIGTWTRSGLALAVAAALPTASQVRNAFIFGGLLFPYAGGTGQVADAARALLAENAATLPRSISDLVHRCWRLIILQPETGFSFAALPAVLAARIANWRFWVLTVVAFLVPVILSANTTNTLRWSQLGIVLLMLACGIGLARISAERMILRWGIPVMAGVGLWLAIRFTISTLGPVGFLMSGPDAVLDVMIPDHGVRTELVRRPDRVLWLGQLYGFYGASKGPIAAPQNGYVHHRLLGTGTADEIRRRLADEGIGRIVFNRRHHATGPGSDHWAWLESDQRQVVVDLLNTLPAAHPVGGVSVYTITPVADPLRK